MENNVSEPLRGPNLDELRDDVGYGSAPPAGNSGSRMIRLVSGLFSVHAEVARQELGREQGRLFAGLLLLFLGLVCLSMLILLLQGFGIWILMQRGLGLGWALLVMSGIDALFGIVAIQLGRRALGKPLLPETRALVRRTISTVLP